MAKADQVTVNVNVNMTISDETARRCCRILEMWMEDNPDKKLICEKVPTTTGYQHRIHLEGESNGSNRNL